MHRRQDVERFCFDDDEFLDNQVDAVRAVDSDAVIQQWQGLLRLEADARFCQVKAQACEIRVFEQSEDGFGMPS